LIARVSDPLLEVLTHARDARAVEVELAADDVLLKKNYVSLLGQPRGHIQRER
jgi:hypothetical protein